MAWTFCTCIGMYVYLFPCCNSINVFSFRSSLFLLFQKIVDWFLMKKSKIKIMMLLCVIYASCKYFYCGLQSVTLCLFFLIRDGQRSGPIFRYWQKNKRYYHVKMLYPFFYYQLKGKENLSKRLKAKEHLFVRIIVFIALDTKWAERKLTQCVWMLFLQMQCVCALI